jgi:hypothetical protein
MGSDGSNTDNRVFSEASTTDNNPLFNIGTSQNGNNDSVDMYIRRGGEQVSHGQSTAPAFDGQWHHIVFVQEDGARSLYGDGGLDALVMNPDAAGDWDVDNTTIGGILRAAPLAFFAGDIDEVATWSRALSPEEITEVFSNNLSSLFPPLADGLVAHWPLDEIVNPRRAGDDPD